MIFSPGSPNPRGPAKIASCDLMTETRPLSESFLKTTKMAWQSCASSRVTRNTALRQVPSVKVSGLYRAIFKYMAGGWGLRKPRRG